MDFFTAMHISASGLSAQRTRVDLATSNLANAESTRGPDGQPYRRLDPVLEAGSFEDALNQQLSPSAGSSSPGVRVSEVVQDQSPGRKIYNPAHPDADKDGFVTLPNVDPVHEVVNLLSAARGYDANATSLETLKGMAQRALDIIR